MTDDHQDPQEFMQMLESMQEFAATLDRVKQSFINLGWAASNAEQMTIKFYETWAKSQ